jgi:hypothetical protein
MHVPNLYLSWMLHTLILGPQACDVRGQSARQLWLIFGDGVNQAADLALGATSIPSWNLTPWMTFGNWF